MKMMIGGGPALQRPFFGGGQQQPRWIFWDPPENVSHSSGILRLSFWFVENNIKHHTKLKGWFNDLKLLLGGHCANSLRAHLSQEMSGWLDAGARSGKPICFGIRFDSKIGSFKPVRLRAAAHCAVQMWQAKEKSPISKSNNDNIHDGCLTWDLTPKKEVIMLHRYALHVMMSFLVQKTISIPETHPGTCPPSFSWQEMCEDRSQLRGLLLEQDLQRFTAVSLGCDVNHSSSERKEIESWFVIVLLVSMAEKFGNYFVHSVICFVV